MSELTGRISDQGPLANHSTRNLFWQIWPLFQWLVVIRGDPRKLLESMFLDISAVSERILPQTTLIYFLL